MWKELLHYAMDHYRFGTIAREVSPGPAGETSPVLLWMHGAMASYSGDSAASLVDHELRTQDQDARRALIATLRDRMPTEVQRAQDELVARWMARGDEPALWRSNTTDLLQAAITDAKDAIASVKHPPHSEMALGMLYTVVLEFAARAHDDPELRLRMGLRGDFPRRPRNGLTVPTMTLRTMRT
jgi:hypothetical protein